MQLIEEEDDLAVRTQLGHQRLDPLLELAAILGAGDQTAQVERDDPLALEAVRYLALHDAQRQSLGDGSLTDARFADQYRVILLAAGEHLRDSLDLTLAPDDWIQLVIARHAGEVASEVIEGRGFRLGMRGRFLSTALLALQQLAALVANGIVGDVETFQYLRGDAVILAGDRQQEMLGADGIGVEVLPLHVGDLEYPLRLLGEGDIADPHRVVGAVDDLFDHLTDTFQVDIQRFQDLDRGALPQPDDTEQQVLGADEVMPQT